MTVLHGVNSTLNYDIQYNPSALSQNAHHDTGEYHKSKNSLSLQRPETTTCTKS